MSTFCVCYLLCYSADRLRIPVISYEFQALQYTHYQSSNGGHYGPIFFKPEKNLEFFRLKNWPIDDSPGRLE